MNRPVLDTLAHRIRPAAKWGDLALPDEEFSLLHRITNALGQRPKAGGDGGNAVGNRRRTGASVLFAGGNGTARTMAAEAIANELRLDLYRVDLAAIAGKYIGETEKNLRRLFDAAEGGGAILFFDEADALFGKRSDVKDSHDRYSNVEVDFLLQRMEAYSGLAILATNASGNIDAAFMRRMRFVVTFPLSGTKGREPV
jgi:SpoVK/Ycf46/Vps4 family AAA+-type ATPase